MASEAPTEVAKGTMASEAPTENAPPPQTVAAAAVCDVPAAPGGAEVGGGNVGEKRKKVQVPLSPEDAESFMRRLKRACLSHRQEAYGTFCEELRKAAAKAKEAAEASKFEEEAAITRQLLLDVEPAFNGRKAYYFEFLRMLPPHLVPKLAEDEAAEKDKAGSEGDSLVEAFDPVRQSWSIAKVRQVQADQIMLHYIGWPNTFDSWFHRTEDEARMRPLSGQGTLGPYDNATNISLYLQLGLTKANSSLQERVRIVLFTLGRGNFVHLETIVRHVSRPRLPKEKRDAIAARVLKILDRLKTMGLVTFQLEEDNKPETIAILRTPVLRGFGTGQEVEGHEQSALDFAPGDFVEILTSSNDWEIAQVNDVVEVPWHQLRVHRIGTRESEDQWIDGDELGARLQLLKPYHRATAIGDTAMPKLGIFKETHTVTFATQAIREQMRKTTRQTATTDEALISTRGVDEIPMKVCDTGTIKNLGAFATRNLESGEFIAEYCGEIISNKEMKQRGLAKTSEYLFNVGGGLTIDASRFGNVTRYMNHSDSPNVRPMVCNHYGCRRVVFYTLCAVEKGTELTYDYGNEYVKNCKHLLV